MSDDGPDVQDTVWVVTVLRYTISGWTGISAKWSRNTGLFTSNFMDSEFTLMYHTGLFGITSHRNVMVMERYPRWHSVALDIRGALKQSNGGTWNVFQSVERRGCSYLFHASYFLRQLYSTQDNAPWQHFRWCSNPQKPKYIAIDCAKSTMRKVLDDDARKKAIKARIYLGLFPTRLSFGRQIARPKKRLFRKGASISPRDRCFWRVGYTLRLRTNVRKTLKDIVLWAVMRFIPNWLRRF